MNYLLDTHIFLWYIDGNLNLLAAAKNIIEDPQSIKFVSIASFWELAIKSSIKKLILDKQFETLPKYMVKNKFLLLPIEFKHLLNLKTLPLHHKDPFDRLLISQAITENLTLISADQHFKPYPVNLTW